MSSRPSSVAGTSGSDDDLDAPIGCGVAVRAVDAEHQLGAGGDGGLDLARVEAVDRDAVAGVAQCAHGVADAGHGVAGVAADVDHVGAVAGQFGGLAEDLVERQPRAVVDLGDDFDVVGAVVCRRRLAEEVLGQPAQVARAALDGRPSLQRPAAPDRPRSSRAG